MAKKTEIAITAKQLRMVPVEALVPYANNAKIHSPEQIAKLRGSLREFGFVSPVLIDGAGNIIAGHGRVLAAQAEGMDQVPCVLAEGLSEAQRKAYILADNRLAELAEWDKGMLRIELEGLDALSFDTGSLGFSEEFLANLFCSQGKEKQQENGAHFWGETEGESSEEYEAFTEKFKPKLTTDDCYTPDNIFECVKQWAVEHYALENREIIRPFYPGGDYKSEMYPPNCVVIDNPPFSILSEICAFYQDKKTDYFLFAPGLTLFSTNAGKGNYVLIGATITYENGAQVCTSFVTNLGGWKIETSPELYERLMICDEANRKDGRTKLPGYIYPKSVIRPADQTLSKYGQHLKIAESDAIFIRALDEQKKKRKAIFGGGFLLSEKAAAEKAAAEKAAAEKRRHKLGNCLNAKNK